MKLLAIITAAALSGAAALCAEFSHIERSLTWSAPAPATNNAGKVLMLRTAPAAEVFWQEWRTNKTAMRAAGYSARPTAAGWQALHWSNGGAK